MNAQTVVNILRKPLSWTYGRVKGLFNYDGATGVPVGDNRPSEQAAALAEHRNWLQEIVRTYRGSNFQRWHPLSQNLTDETAAIRQGYRRALREPTVKAALLGKVINVAALDLNIIPPNRKNPRDLMIKDFVKTALSKQQGGVPRMVWNIGAHGLMDGWSLNEKVWRVGTQGPLKNKWTLAALKAKDTNYIQPHIDQFRNVIGFRAMQANAGSIYPPEDFVHFAYMPFFENPTGMSDLRAANRAIDLKEAAINLRIVFLDKFAGPFLVGKWADPATREMMAAHLADARARGWISIPKSAEIQVLDLAMGSIEAFKNAIDDFDREIVVSVYGAFLHMLEGQGMDARGNSLVQKSTAELFVWFLAYLISQVITEQIIPDLVGPNFGWDVEPPVAVLSAVNPAEIKAELEIDQVLNQMGVDLSLEDLYERSGRTPPKDRADTLRGASQSTDMTNGAPGGGAGNDPFPGPAGGAAVPGGGAGPGSVQPGGAPQQQPATDSGMTFAEWDGWVEVTDFDEEDWRREEGPRGGTKWVNVKTGAEQYSATNPGAGSSPGSDGGSAHESGSRAKGLKARAVHALKVAKEVGVAAALEVMKFMGGNSQDVLQTADDFARLSFSGPMASSGLGGHAVHDPVRDVTGISANDTALVVSHAMAWAWTKAKEKLGIGQARPDAHAEESDAKKLDLVRKLIGVYARMYGVTDYEVPGDDQLRALMAKRTGTTTSGRLPSGLPDKVDEHAEDYPVSSSLGLVRRDHAPEGGGGEVAGRDRESARAEALLRKSKAEGLSVLHKLASQALRRHLKAGSLGSSWRFFSDDEARELGEHFAAVNAQAELLGRYRMRERLEKAREGKGSLDRFAEDNAFATFAEPDIPVLAPEAAVSYFKSLVPTLGIDPQRFGAELRRKAFTLALGTDKTLLERVQGIIARGLEQGETHGTQAADIEDVLTRAGVTPKNPQYSEMVWRTNVMDSLNAGVDDEQASPEVREFFPVWEYLGVDDHRAGADHRPKFGRFYPAQASFAEVRGERPFNCRCRKRPVSVYEWEGLSRQGKRVESRW